MSVKRLLIFACFVCLLVPCFAVAAKKKAPPAPPAKLIDSGTFGVFVNGRRVATETFKIEQQALASVTTSDIRLEDGSSHQQSKMQMASNGTLIKYEWKEVLPLPVEAVVEPNDQFLVQRFQASDSKNPKSTTHLLPASTAILDDNFFTHRQILAWRYLSSSGCGGGGSCKLEKTQFGVLVPHQQTSVTVSISFHGKETLSYKGAALELSRFKLNTEGQEWDLWLDGAHKLIRIVIASENTEVVRD